MLRNLTLAALASEDLNALRPHLKERHVETGALLTPQGAQVETIWFPVTALIANTVTFSDGRSAETFAMGVEGVSGLAPFLASMPCAWAVEVKQGGIAFAISATRLRERLDISAPLRNLLMRRVADYQAQASLGAACGALHGITARLARLLLVHAERQQNDSLAITQQDFADLLGCQRTTVTASARDLKQRKLIRYLRGVVHITDREGLIGEACECYAMQRAWPTV